MPTNHIITPELMQLARDLEGGWADRLAQLEQSGVPMNAYNNLTSRTDASSLMPEEVSNSFLKGLQAQTAALELFTRVPVGRAQVRFPVLSALPVAYWVSGDTGLKQTTEVNWSNKFLNIEEIAVIVPVPENVIDDTDQPIWDQVQPLAEQAVGRTLDQAVFFGVNAPGTFPTAVITAAAAAGNTVTRGTNAAAAGGLVGDFSDLFGTVEADGYSVDSLLANTVYRGKLRQVRATTGESLLGDEGANLSNQTMVFGVDVAYPMRGLWPTGGGAVEAIALQRDQFVLGVRRDITWKLLDQAVIQDNTGAIVYNLAQQDMVALRLTMRVGWQVSNTISYDQPVEANRYPAGVLHA